MSFFSDWSPRSQHFYWRVTGAVLEIPDILHEPQHKARVWWETKCRSTTYTKNPPLSKQAYAGARCCGSEHKGHLFVPPLHSEGCCNTATQFHSVPFEGDLRQKPVIIQVSWWEIVSQNNHASRKAGKTAWKSSESLVWAERLLSNPFRTAIPLRRIRLNHLLSSARLCATVFS